MTTSTRRSTWRRWSSSSRRPADFVKLSAWLVHDLQSGATGIFDAELEMPHPKLRSLRDQFLYTYGFSFLYKRNLFPTFSFMATSWGEDQDILKRVREGGRAVALFRDTVGLCLHNQHGENCSRSFAQRSVPFEGLARTPLGPLLSALPDIARALTNDRKTGKDSGVYGNKVVKSEVAGGLFCWDQQLDARGRDEDVTLKAFTDWLWSGNGFSEKRYEKLGLERPPLPQGVGQPLLKDSTQAAADSLRAGTGYGLESLRLSEGLQQPHDPGAITNPSSYKPGGIANPSKALPFSKPASAPGIGFGQSPRKFVL